VTAGEGANSAQAEEWMTFLGNAIGGLHQAAAELRARKADFESKRDWFRRGRKHGAIPRENSVSQALKQLFDLIRAEQQVSGTGTQAVDLRHIRIECELPRPLDPGISDEAKPTDLSIVLTKDNELDFRIEAKTVLNDAELRSEYLGPRGLQRFDDNSNPYTIQPFGGMVAYVVDDDANAWNVKIGQAIAVNLGSTRSGTRIIGHMAHHVSHHRIRYGIGTKPMNRNVEVIHFALEIDANPPKR
jgi:hypothetical protein